MSIRAVFVVAACLQVALANPPCYPPPPPPPCIKFIEVPYPVVEQVNVPVPAPVPVPVLAPTITETWTRLAGTTSGNGAEQKVLTTSAPAPPVALPLPSAPCAGPYGGPLAGAEFIFNANAPALAFGASPLALNGGLPYNGIIGGYGADYGYGPYEAGYGYGAGYGPAYGAGYGPYEAGYGYGAGYGPAYGAGYGYGPYEAGYGYAPFGAGYGYGAGYGHGHAAAPVEYISHPSFAAPGYNGLQSSIANPAVVGNNPLGHGYHGHGWY